MVRWVSGAHEALPTFPDLTPPSLEQPLSGACPGRDGPVRVSSPQPLGRWNTASGGLELPGYQSPPVLPLRRQISRKELARCPAPQCSLRPQLGLQSLSWPAGPKAIHPRRCRGGVEKSSLDKANRLWAKRDRVCQGPEARNGLAWKSAQKPNLCCWTWMVALFATHSPV